MTSDYKKLGGVHLPLDPDDIQYSMSEVSDPCLNGLLDFFESSITAEIGEAYAKVADQLQLQSAVVQETIPLEPSKFLALGQNFEFPLLALYRTKSKKTQYTLSEFKMVSDFTLDYILPPLSLQGVGKLDGTKNAVQTVLSTALNTMKHPSFNDGYSLENFGVGDLLELEFTPGSWAALSEDSALIHPTLQVKFQIEEEIGFSDFSPASVPFEGTDLEITEQEVPAEPIPLNT